MTETANAAITLPEIEITAPGEAKARLPKAGEAVLSALMIRAMRAHADSLGGEKTAKTVSISVDVTGADFAGGEVALSSKVDRQTRTIIFMSGTLSADGTTLLKATSIFRLTDA
ncbi:MAG: hypothetical protein RIB03_02815 [Henriciella sp.]|uniref:hypothetical protein n=1 Tax=Henriciella sp. TaxID=1968823 RepID=UPI0032ED118D